MQVLTKSSYMVNLSIQSPILLFLLSPLFFVSFLGAEWVEVVEGLGEGWCREEGRWPPVYSLPATLTAQSPFAHAIHPPKPPNFYATFQRRNFQTFCPEFPPSLPFRVHCPPPMLPPPWWKPEKSETKVGRISSVKSLDCILTKSLRKGKSKAAAHHNSRFSWENWKLVLLHDPYLLQKSRLQK